MAKWIELTERQSVLRQVDAKLSSRGRRNEGRPESGVRAAARALGISEADARRAVKVAALTEDAKAAARATGLDDNRTALLQASKAAPEQQADVIRHIAEQKATKLADDPLNDFEAKERQVAALMAAWNRASPEARAEFLGRIDGPLMDRRYA